MAALLATAVAVAPAVTMSAGLSGIAVVAHRYDDACAMSQPFQTTSPGAGGTHDLGGSGANPTSIT